MSSMNTESQLQEYSCIYKELKRVLIERDKVNNINYSIDKINLLAWFAWQFHPGLYADAEIERRILYISEKLFKKSQSLVRTSKVETTKKRRVLHVASGVFPVGGHTRLLYNLVKRDSDSYHSLILTRQGDYIVPDWLTNAITNANGEIINLQSNDAVQKATSIREIACSQADIVFLHIHPDDSIPLIALAADPTPPVVFVNHADHVFCLGTGLADTVACIRSWSAEFSIERRLAKRVDILPVPLEFESVSNDFRDYSREVLGLSPSDTMILTVASAYKFIPNENYNYFNTVNKIIDRNSNVCAKVIGVSPNDAEIVGYIPDKRIELLGVVENPSIYYAAADIYLDAMPFASFTSLLEAAYFGAYPVLQYSPVSKLNIANDIGIQNIVRHTDNEEDMLGVIERAIYDKQGRLEACDKISHNVQFNHAGQGWMNFLLNIYKDIACNVKDESKIKLFSKVEYKYDPDDIDSARLPNDYKIDERYFAEMMYKNGYFLSVKDFISCYYAVFSCLTLSNSRKIKNFLGILHKKIRGEPIYDKYW